MIILVAAGSLAIAACSSSDADVAIGTSTDTSTTPRPTDPPATDPPATDPSVTNLPVTDPPATDPPEGEVGIDPIAIVEMLASDDLQGRDNQTDGSTAARELLVPIVANVADPAYPDASGTAGYLQEYDAGTNVVAVMPGRGVLADEYVLIGAHYDHLGTGDGCDTRGETDDVICNGAADNAAGVAAVLAIIDALAAADPVADQDSTDNGRRSVIVGLWDGEEDGLVGSEVYVADPAIPLEQTVAYVNFDIQGAALSPALADSTVLVGAETGGPVLIEAAARATGASALDYASFSLIFGQGRSDHATLVDAGVPSVFFTDANNGCYHTVLDDFDHLDTDKLLLQIETAGALFNDLVTMDAAPTFVPDTPLSTYDDAVELLVLVARNEPDFGLLGAAEAGTAKFLVDLQAIVDAGPDLYDDAAGGTVLGGASTLVGALADSDCIIPS